MSEFERNHAFTMARFKIKAPGFRPRPTDAIPRRRTAWINLVLLVALVAAAVLAGS